jgi:methionine salvage enolase-phosphatase E1
MVTMKYKGADVFFDSSGGIPSQHMYFLNTDYMDLVVHRDANVTMLDEVASINQDAVVKTILWMGNLSMSNRQLQGVLKA